MRFRQTVCAVLVAVLVAGSGQWVDTFYDDTHYSFTYYMARECGYTPLQAHRVASANVSIDYAKATEPVQSARELLSTAVPVVGGGGIAPLLIRNALSKEAQTPRVDFHAFRDARGMGRSEQAAVAEIALQRRALWNAAKSMRNPGVALHFIQDESSHAGYASAGGHWFSAAAGIEALLRAAPSGAQLAANELARQTGVAAPTVYVPEVSLAAVNTLADPTLPMGATTDFLSYRPDKTNAMVATTLTALSQFMTEMSPRQRLRALACTEAMIRPVTQALAKANFVTRTNEQYAAAANEMATKLSLGLNPLKTAENDSGPSSVRADAIITQALARKLEMTPYKPKRVEYDFSASGSPRGLSPDEFTLYGTVTTRLRQSGPPQGPVEVSVWAKPTRGGERQYQLDCASVTGPGAGGGPILPNMFERLPVGDLMVRAVTSSGKVIEKSIELKELEMDVVLEIPAAPEKTSTCGNKKAEAVRQMCTAASKAGFTDSQADHDEAFNKEVKKEEECEEEEKEKEKEKAKTETTNAPTTPQPPAPSGPSMGKILGWTTVLGGAVVGGLYVAQEAAALAEESYTTTPTTTTNSNPAPAANVASSVGLGGFSCSTANDTSGFRNCTGSINVRAGTLMGARQGSSVAVLVVPSAFVGTFTAPGVGGTSGTVSLRATLPRTCATQVAINFSTTGGGTAFESIQVSIPVSCP